MRPSHPAVDAAVRFLRAGIERGIFGDGGRLPTMVELARCADVSKVSMTKAVAILVEEGLLDARRRRGILLRRHQPEPVPTPRTPSKAEAVAQDILRKYLRGVYGSNHVFGSLKELQASYGASFRTLKRALESLRRDGVIVPYGRGYRMRGPVPTPQPKTLVLFVGRQTRENLTMSYAKSFYYPLLYALERECGQRNLRLEVEQAPWRTSALGRKGTIAHFVAHDEPPDARTLSLISQLQRLGGPVFVFRDRAHEAAFGRLRAKKNLVFFECDDVAAGGHVGRYLLALGHRRVCYLGRSTRESWSTGRLKGLERVFELAELGGAVTVVDVDTSVAPLRRRARKVAAEWEAKILSLLATRAVTAWVGAEDQLVIERVLPALQRRGVALGQAASIVSFNDQTEAFDHKLTSFNFNSTGLAAAVVALAVVPDALRRAEQKRGVVRIDGYLVDRGSVRTNTP